MSDHPGFPANFDGRQVLPFHCMQDISADPPTQSTRPWGKVLGLNHLDEPTPSALQCYHYPKLVAEFKYLSCKFVMRKALCIPQQEKKRFDRENVKGGDYSGSTQV
jgi:hypothetical protein